METRQKTEYKIYYLALADVRGGVDKANPVVIFDDIQKLKDWYEAQKGAWDDKPSSDSFGNVHGYNKTFKKGSLLEWYNPATSLEPTEYPDAVGGVGYKWVDNFAFNFPFNPA